ncbi:hypothetical protein ACYB2S_12820 [Corynebacterium variabile]|uniref:hypothetical protein n=1 Tax=Corynebacterium variabile TaxID=1727 RepID=UPI003CB3B9D6
MGRSSAWTGTPASSAQERKRSVLIRDRASPPWSVAAATGSFVDSPGTSLPD